MCRWATIRTTRRPPSSRCCVCATALHDLLFFFLSLSLTHTCDWLLNVIMPTWSWLLAAIIGKLHARRKTDSHFTTGFSWNQKRFQKAFLISLQQNPLLCSWTESKIHESRFFLVKDGNPVTEWTSSSCEFEFGEVFKIFSNLRQLLSLSRKNPRLSIYLMTRSSPNIFVMFVVKIWSDNMYCTFLLSKNVTCTYFWNSNNNNNTNLRYMYAKGNFLF